MSPALGTAGAVAAVIVYALGSWVREGRRLDRRARELEHSFSPTFGCGVKGTVVPLRRADVNDVAHWLSTTNATVTPGVLLDMDGEPGPAEVLDGRARFARRGNEGQSGC